MKILFSSTSSPTFNLAAEEYLFLHCKADFLFLYVNEPSVIIGSNQILRNEVNVRFCTENNIQILRRISGGGAVYHDLGNLNYCFINATSKGKSTLNSEFLLPVTEVLKSINIQVKTGQRKDLWLPDGYKISGTASHITKARELHHGTLLYNADLINLLHSLKVSEKDTTQKGIASVPSSVKNIKTYLEEQDKTTYNNEDFFQELIHGFMNLYHIATLSELEVEEVLRIKEIEIKYNSTEWTYRR